MARETLGLKGIADGVGSRGTGKSPWRGKASLRNRQGGGEPIFHSGKAFFRAPRPGIEGIERGGGREWLGILGGSGIGLGKVRAAEQVIGGDVKKIGVAQEHGSGDGIDVLFMLGNGRLGNAQDIGKGLLGKARLPTEGAETRT